jgi:hypothetical protein
LALASWLSVTIPENWPRVTQRQRACEGPLSFLVEVAGGGAKIPDRSDLQYPLVKMQRFFKVGLG